MNSKARPCTSAERRTPSLVTFGALRRQWQMSSLTKGLSTIARLLTPLLTRQRLRHLNQSTRGTVPPKTVVLLTPWFRFLSTHHLPRFLINCSFTMDNPPGPGVRKSSCGPLDPKVLQGRAWSCLCHQLSVHAHRIHLRPR